LLGENVRENKITAEIYLENRLYHDQRHEETGKKAVFDGANEPRRLMIGYGFGHKLYLNSKF